MKEYAQRNSEKNALIFIPDISGFTKFVNDTEIEHSQHIIEELIEVIILANQMNLAISEIEGDAVLFYRLGEAPSADTLAEQTKQMFYNFHAFLHTIDIDRVCECGACKTAINLTLKFLVHYGEVGLSKIQDHTKLMGRDVIIAHRLLKNDVNSNEYVLMTSEYTSQQDSQSLLSSFNWSKIQPGTISYEHIGEVQFKYITLSELRANIPPPPPPKKATKYPNPIKESVQIDAPIGLVYNTIINLDHRKEWTHGLKSIHYNKDEIPRIGSKHLCELPSGVIELETVQNKLKEGEIEFAERATKSRLLPNATTFFIMKTENSGTSLIIEFHYQKLRFIGWLVDFLFRKKFTFGINQSILNLKECCEKMK
jgi:hypothetical protein